MTQKYKDMKTKSVKSINPCQYVIQTSDDNVKAYGGVFPIAIGAQEKSKNLPCRCGSTGKEGREKPACRPGWNIAFNTSINYYLSI